MCRRNTAKSFHYFFVPLPKHVVFMLPGKKLFSQFLASETSRSWDIFVRSVDSFCPCLYADRATKLWKGHNVKNVSFPHMSTEHYGALNTLPEQTVFGELRRRTWVFKPDGIHGPAYLSHTPQKPPLFLLPLFICSTVVPGLLNGDLTFPL